MGISDSFPCENFMTELYDVISLKVEQLLYLLKILYFA